MTTWVRSDFEQALRAICEQAGPGPDFGTVASRIGRHLPWEFDGRYDERVNDHFVDGRAL